MKGSIRLYALLALVLLSAYILAAPYVFKRTGVFVSSVDNDNNCSNVNVGGIVNQVSGAVVANSQDFEDQIRYVTAGSYVPLVVGGGPAGCTAVRDGDLGFEVSDISSSQLKFSSDIGRSFVTTLKVGDIGRVSDYLDVMEKRVSILKFTGYKVHAEDDVIKVTSLDRDISPLKQACKFEIGVARTVAVGANQTSIDINGRMHPFEVRDSVFTLNGTSHSFGEIFYIDGVGTKLLRETNTSFTIRQVFVNNSYIDVVGSPSINYLQEAGGFRLQFPVSLSAQATDNFNKISKSLKPVIVSGVRLLDASFVYVLDSRAISQLPIPSEILGQGIASLSVIGFDNDLKNLESLAAELNLCLHSGVIDSGLQQLSVEQVEPQNRMLAEASLSAFVISALAVGFILVQTRYKVYKYWYTMAGLVLAELFIVFGFVAFAQGISGFLIDLTTIYGLSVFGAISVGQMLLVMEYILQKKDMSLSYRLKKLGRISWLVNLSVLAAAVVLIIFAAGFGFVLLFGTLVGWLITKPMFLNMLTKLQV